MNCFEEMKEIINDMQNISIIESLCTVADSFEGGVFCGLAHVNVFNMNRVIKDFFG